MKRIQSFDPIVARHPKVLILGSMPGEKSLQMNQYYAHPQNSFWFIMGKLVGFDATIDYEKRVQQVRAKGICIWDVLKSCVRPGSLDSAIDVTSAVTNDFNTFFAKHKNISNVFFNGAKAEQLFKKHIMPNLPDSASHLNYIKLPSTSPAHAAMSRTDKLKQWRIVNRTLTQASSND